MRERSDRQRADACRMELEQADFNLFALRIVKGIVTDGRGSYFVAAVNFPTSFGPGEPALLPLTEELQIPLVNMASRIKNIACEHRGGADWEKIDDYVYYSRCIFPK